MSLQLFGSDVDIKPMPLTEEARTMREKDTNFLAFYPKKENMGGEVANKDWAKELDDTFAKPGVWAFRYQSIAPQPLTGTGYIDMGVPKNKRVELQYGHKSGQQLTHARMGQPHNAWAYQSYGYTEQARGYAPEHAKGTDKPERARGYAPERAKGTDKPERNLASNDGDESPCAAGFYLLNGKCTDT